VKRLATDFTNQQLGHLWVIERYLDDRDSNPVYKCYCGACRRFVRMEHLSKQRTSCGCLKGGRSHLHYVNVTKLNGRKLNKNFVEEAKCIKASYFHEVQKAKAGNYKLKLTYEQAFCLLYNQSYCCPITGKILRPDSYCFKHDGNMTLTREDPKRAWTFKNLQWVRTAAIS
jgi:hypothetical protein